MQEIIKYLLPIALFLIILVLVIVITRKFQLAFASQKRENNYKISMITTINEKAEDNEAYFDSINELYTEYSNSAQKKDTTLDVFTLNTKLIHELRSNNHRKYYKDDLLNNGNIANEVEEINKHLHERLRNDDEVLIEILGKIDELSVDDQARIALETFKGEALSYINAIIANCDGRIAEKDIALAQAELRLKKARQLRIISFLVGAVGVFSGLITILNQLFFK